MLGNGRPNQDADREIPAPESVTLYLAALAFPHCGIRPRSLLRFALERRSRRHFKMPHMAGGVNVSLSYREPRLAETGSLERGPGDEQQGRSELEQGRTQKT